MLNFQINYAKLSKSRAFDLQRIVSRETILKFEDVLKGMPEHHIDPPLKHHFAPGSYAREIFIPAGSTVVGKIHKHGHLNIISRGHGKVVTEFGELLYDARERPYTFVSEPGTKRALHTLSDTIWTTFHVTEARTPEAAELDVIAPSYDALEYLQPSPMLGIE